MKCSDALQMIFRQMCEQPSISFVLPCFGGPMAESWKFNTKFQRSTAKPMSQSETSMCSHLYTSRYIIHACTLTHAKRTKTSSIHPSICQTQNLSVLLLLSSSLLFSLNSHKDTRLTPSHRHSRWCTVNLNSLSCTSNVSKGNQWRRRRTEKNGGKKSLKMKILNIKPWNDNGTWTIHKTFWWLCEGSMYRAECKCGNGQDCSEQIEEAQEGCQSIVHWYIWLSSPRVSHLRLQPIPHVPLPTTYTLLQSTQSQKKTSNKFHCTRLR